VDDHTEEHSLTQHLEQTGWNNIPLPLKELLSEIVKQVVRQDVVGIQRKFTVNERIQKLQDRMKRMKQQ
jgi:hypothetical protein